MKRIEQIEESGAGGEVAAFYADFKATVRASFVPTVFRSLARFPGYLLPAWERLGPALGTRYADGAATALRVAMADRLGAAVGTRAAILPALSPAALQEIRAVLETFAHVIPRSWLGIVALGEAWAGRVLPGGAALTAEERRPTPRGVPPAMPAIPMLDQDVTAPRVQAIFAAARTRLERPAVPSIYRTLARWPDYLEAVWEQVIDAGILAAIRAELPALTARAVAVVRGLPCDLQADRASAAAHLPVAAVEEIDAILGAYRRTMPETTFQILGLLRDLAVPPST